MAIQPLKLYWDSCNFIALLNQDPEWEACQTVLVEADKGEVRIIVSALVLAEVVRPRGAASPLSRYHRELIRRFFERESIVMRTLDRHIAEKAQELSWEFGLHPRDAIHMATAISTECDYFETTDRHFLSLPARVKDLPISIRKPAGLGQTRLDL